MLLLNTVTEYCRREFEENSESRPGENCVGSECCYPNKNNGVLDPAKCLERAQTHGKQNGKRPYDCERMLDFYTCRYAWAYCSEMTDCITKIASRMTDNVLDVLSVGCGPAPDLMAFDRLKSLGKEFVRQTINYRGYDLSDSWNKIHDFISSNLSDGIRVEFRRGVDNDLLKNPEYAPKSSVLIMNKLLSNISTEKKGNNSKAIRSIFEEIAELICCCKPDGKSLLVIANDIEGYFDRSDHQELMVKQIKQEGLKLREPIKGCYEGDTGLFNFSEMPFTWWNENYAAMKHLRGQYLILEVE